MKYKYFLYLFCFSVLVGLISCPDGSDPASISLWFEQVVVKIDIGESVFLDFHLEPENANVRLVWKSGDDKIVAVSDTGVVTGVGPGAASVYVSSETDSGLTAKCTVRVANNELVRNWPRNGDFRLSPEKWYYLNAAVGCSYELSWNGNIALSAYHGETDGEVIFEDRAGGTAGLSVTRSERVYLKLTPLEEDAVFSNLRYSLANPGVPQTWTFLLFSNGSGSLDFTLFRNIEKILRGYHEDLYINVLLLLDKEKESSQGMLEENFMETRMYMLTLNADKEDSEEPDGRLERIWEGGTDFPDMILPMGKKLNMGDAGILRQFIDFGKNNFPASHYALVISAHGFGPWGVSRHKPSGNDLLHPGEISAELDSSHSMDIIGFDSCLMGNLEVAYQFRNITGILPEDTRFYGDVLLASPFTTNTLVSWPFEGVFQRLSIHTGNTAQTEDLNTETPGTREAIYDPAALDALTLGNMFVEELRDYARDEFGTDEVEYKSSGLICYNLKQVAPVKKLTDKLAVSLYENGERSATETLRDDDTAVMVFDFLPLFSSGRYYVIPLVDLQDLATGMVADSGSFSAGTRGIAAELLTAIDDMVSYSYYMYLPPNEPGISIFTADYHDAYSERNFTWDNIFENQWWYTPLQVLSRSLDENVSEKFYGGFDFCAEGDGELEVIEGNGKVENWFELLDAWYYTWDGEGERDYNNYKF